MVHFERGRPPEFQDLRPTSVQIEAKLKNRAKEMNLNISEICREALEQAVNFPLHKERVNIIRKLEPISILMRRKIKQRMMEDPATATRWAAWIKEKHEIEITPEELQIFAGYNV